MHKPTPEAATLAFFLTLATATGLAIAFPEHWPAAGILAIWATIAYALTLRD